MEGNQSASSGMEESEIIILENLPVRYNKEDIINYVETTLDVGVNSVKVHAALPGRALVKLDEEIKDFSQAVRDVKRSRLEGNEVRLLKTKKECAIIIEDVNFAKLTEKDLRLCLRTKFGIEDSAVQTFTPWPDFKIAVLQFQSSYQEEMVAIFAESDHVSIIMSSAGCHMTASPFYQNFHDFIGKNFEKDETDTNASCVTTAERAEPESSSDFNFFTDTDSDADDNYVDAEECIEDGTSQNQNRRNEDKKDELQRDEDDEEEEEEEEEKGSSDGSCRYSLSQYTKTSEDKGASSEETEESSSDIEGIDKKKDLKITYIKKRVVCLRGRGSSSIRGGLARGRRRGGRIGMRGVRGSSARGRRRRGRGIADQHTSEDESEAESLEIQEMKDGKNEKRRRFVFGQSEMKVKEGEEKTKQEEKERKTEEESELKEKEEETEENEEEEDDEMGDVEMDHHLLHEQTRKDETDSESEIPAHKNDSEYTDEEEEQTEENVTKSSVCFRGYGQISVRGRGQRGRGTFRRERSRGGMTMRRRGLARIKNIWSREVRDQCSSEYDSDEQDESSEEVEDENKRKTAEEEEKLREERQKEEEVVAERENEEEIEESDLETEEEEEVEESDLETDEDDETKDNHNKENRSILAKVHQYRGRGWASVRGKSRGGRWNGAARQNFARQSQRQSHLKSYNVKDSQSQPQQSTEFRKTLDEFEAKSHAEDAAKDEEIRRLKEKLAQQSICREKLPLEAWQAKLLPHCFKTSGDCRVYFNKSENVAYLEGPGVHVKELQLELLKELKKIKKDLIAVSSATVSVLSKESGKKYLKNLSKDSSGLCAFLQDNNLVVAAREEKVLKSRMSSLKKQLNFLETVTSEADILPDKLTALKDKLERGRLVEVSWKQNGKEIFVEGIKDDVLSSRKIVEDLIEESGIHKKSFQLSGPSAKFLHRFHADKIHSILNNVNTEMNTCNGDQIELTFSGNKKQTSKVYTKLQELATKVVSEHLLFKSEFELNEDIVLITRGFHSEELKEKIENFENKEKCLVITELPKPKPRNKSPSKQPHQSKYKPSKKTVEASHDLSHPFSHSEVQLNFSVKDTCKLVIKPSGDIVKETSDILVCVVNGNNMNLQRTNVGKAFKTVVPSLSRNLEAEQAAHPNDAVLMTKGPFDSLKCKAICHVILSPWKPKSSPDQLSTAVISVLAQANALGAKSISFPVLGCGKAFQFPASVVAKTIVGAIKSANIGRNLQKIVILANYNGTELFDEFQTASSRHFSSVSVPVQGAVGGFRQDQCLQPVHQTNISDEDDEHNDYRDRTFSELLDTSLSNAQVRIIVLDDKRPLELWQALKKKIEEVCLHTDYMEQETVDTLSENCKKRLVDKAKKLFVCFRPTQHPETKTLVYMIKGERLNINRMKECIFYELQQQALPQIISDISPQRGTVQFLGHAAGIDEMCPSYWTLAKNESYSKANVSGFASLVRKKATTLPQKDQQSFLVDVDAKTSDAIKKLIAKTGNPLRGRGGKDTKGLNHSAFEVIDIKRVENTSLFEPYMKERQRQFKKMYERRQLCPDIGSIPGSKGKVMTTEILDDFMKEELYWEVNEHYLFHGTKPDVWTTLTAKGMDPRVSGQSCMFGQGVYAAEEFTKSDNYTDSLGNRTPLGTPLYIILTRMLLGNVFVCDHNHETTKTKDAVKLKRPPCVHCKKDMCTCPNQELYDSVMGDGIWVFREFVVYNQQHCYPEYVITYKRK